MQPLPTEARPRSVCANCGEPLPPPNGSATFVYGVGAVGYQSCASCGAKWRYLWRDLPAARVKPDRSRRLVAVLAAVALVALVVVGAIALARSQRWSGSDAPAPPATSSVPASGSTPGSGASVGLADVVRYDAIARPMNEARADFMDWLLESATATPQFDVNRRTIRYVDGARAGIQQLEDAEWPAAVAGEIDALVGTTRRFVDDLEPVLVGQAGSPSYIAMITGEASAVEAADRAVQQKLGIAEASE